MLARVGRGVYNGYTIDIMLIIWSFDMKKKLILATAIVLLFAISVSMLVGCDEIIKKNETRDAKQVVATVTYGDRTEYVYKYELETVFNNYAPAYVNYYGMTYEEAANTLVKSLAQQKLLNLFALYKVAELKGVNVPTKAEELLTNSERNKAVTDSNESMLNTLVSIVEDLITEDNANAGGSDTSKKDAEETVEVTKDNEVFVRFETNGATAIDKQRIAKGTKATEPDEPTKTGYTFYGWYTDKDCNEEGYVGDEFDFDTVINESTTLYAKWVKHTDARTERPEAEEEDDYDPEDNTVEIAAKFFTEEYQKGLFDDTDAESVFNKSFVEADFAKNIIFDEKTTTLQAVLKEYVSEGLADMKKQLMANLYKDNIEDCYEYYLNSQMQSLLVTRLKRMISDSVEVTEAEIKKQYDDAVAKNMETYKDNESGYSSALTGSLSETYYHPTKDYGFVVNILLKLDDESMTKLTDFAKENPSSPQAVLIRRDQLIADMKVKVSNPNYKADSVIEDKDGNEIEVRDAMTDPLNPYNDVIGKDATKQYDKSYEYEVSEGNYENDYNQIVDFVEVDGKYQIVFKATQHPAMAYLLKSVPAFDYVEDGVTKNGIIHQIYNSFDKVNAATGLTHEQRVYWLREVATTWLYLVGDDSGALNSSSNNNGLGYLVAPEGESNSYIEDFTDYAQSLIKKGTGAYCTEETTDFTTSFDGNKKAYVIGDNLVAKNKYGVDEVGSTSNAYAGVFVLLNSYSVWDNTNVKGGSGTLDETTKTLPYDYVITFAKDTDDVKTLEDTIRDTLKDAKATDKYNSIVNTAINSLKDTITYNDKVIKDLWKDLD